MCIVVEIDAEEEVTASAILRLRLLLSRFAAVVVQATVRAVPRGPQRVLWTAEVRFVGGRTVSLDAEDEASAAALLHFIDRLGRAVARDRLRAGGRHG